MKTAGNSTLQDALQCLVGESDPSLLEPHQLRQRLQALDSLDAYFTFAAPEAFPCDSIEANLYRRATAIGAKLEAVNAELYAEIQAEIQCGHGPDALLRWAQPVAEIPSLDSEAAPTPVNGLAYDHLDELLSGVLQLEEPAATLALASQEMVFYQPTPTRHIFQLLRLTDLSAADVLVDLGSGLGHVPLLVAICTRAHCIGIELEAAYIERARQCGFRLKLNNVTFLKQDAREADLSTGTVFYLYTPFRGSVLATVLERLRREAATRSIRICSYGPSTTVIAREPWLQAASPPQTDRITLFRSLN